MKDEQITQIVKNYINTNKHAFDFCFKLAKDIYKNNTKDKTIDKLANILQFRFKTTNSNKLINDFFNKVDWDNIADSLIETLEHK